MAEDGITEATIKSELSESANVKINDQFLTDNSALLDAGNNFIDMSGTNGDIVFSKQCHGFLPTDLAMFQPFFYGAWRSVVRDGRNELQNIEHSIPFQVCHPTV